MGSYLGRTFQDWGLEKGLGPSCLLGAWGLGPALGQEVRWELNSLGRVPRSRAHVQGPLL